jgi:hypothetical protein
METLVASVKLHSLSKQLKIGILLAHSSMVPESSLTINTWIYWFWCGKIATLYWVLEPNATFSDSFRELFGSGILPG